MDNFKRIISVITIITLLMGCGIADIESGIGQEFQLEGIVQNQALDYEVPPNVPHVLADQVGYETKSTKIAIFCGKEMKDTFEVVDAESGETVYTGEIVTGEYDAETEEYTNYGSFTELDKNGTYYIQTAIIGQSYPFIIGEDLYHNLIPEMCKIIYDRRCNTNLVVRIPDQAEPLEVTGGWYTGNGLDRDLVEGSTIAANLLLTFELYPEEFTDDTGIAESGNHIPDILDEVKYEVDWMLGMQDKKTGGLYTGIIERTNEPQTLRGTSREATASFAGIMGNFYHIYKNYDLKFASICLNAGEKAFRYLSANETESSEAGQYFAAAQLYRATGSVTYHTYVKQYNSESDKVMPDDSSWELYGDITYLMTRRSVDTELCRRLMDKCMNKAEYIVEDTQNNPYFVSNFTNTLLLKDMLYLSVVGHIITNHEYATVMENHLHYFLGRNPGGVSYIEGVGSRFPSEYDEEVLITQNPQLTSALIFMLGEIMHRETVLAAERK